MDPLQGIQSVRERALQAVRDRDVDAWRRTFWPETRYQQPDGRWIGLDELTAGLRSQFAAFDSLETSSEILELRPEPWGVRTTVLQTVTARTTVLFFWKQRLDVRRRSSIDWEERGGEWRVSEVRVLEEEVRRNGRVVDPYRRRFSGEAG